jgi:hypothetical protein
MGVYLFVSAFLAVLYLVQHRRSPKLPLSLPRLKRDSYLPFKLQWAYLTDCRQLFLEAYQAVCVSLT